MPGRSRRTQIIGLAVFVAFVYFLFFNGDYGTDFRTTTENAIRRKHSRLRGDLSDEDLQAQTNAMLKDILDAKSDGKKADTGGTGADEKPRIRLQGGIPVLEGGRRAGDSVPVGSAGEPAKVNKDSIDEVSIGGRKTMPKQQPTPPQQKKEGDNGDPKPREKAQQAINQPVKQGTRKPPKEAEEGKPGAGVGYSGGKPAVPDVRGKNYYHSDGGGEETAFNGNKVETATDPGEQMAREELQNILKKSPIVIFSKSYCPFSKRAKALLLETYTITPTPYVVELDEMTTILPKPKSNKKDYHDSHDDSQTHEAPPVTMGAKIQSLLASLTGRRTVPNIMVNSQSIGGADEVVKMDGEGTLVEKIKKLGGNRIVSVEKKKRKTDDD